MNANVRRAMDIAMEISDKQKTIEGIKADLDELTAELSELFGGKKPAKSNNHQVDRKVAYGSGGYWRRAILEHISKDPMSVGELADAIGCGDPWTSAKGLTAEISRMVKGGTLERVSKGVYRLASGQKKGSRYAVPRSNFGGGGFTKPLVLKILKAAGGKKMTLVQIREAIKKDGHAIGKSTVSSAISKLLADKAIKRTAPATYMMASGKAKKPVAISKSKNGTAYPRGYWKPAILKAMKQGVKYKSSEIIKRIGVPKDKAAAATTAIHTLGKQGVLKKVEDGIYINTGKANAPASEGPKEPKKAKAKPAIKNFHVRKLTAQQETFLQRQQPDSITTHILKFMKRDKQYTIEDVYKKLKGKAKSKTTVRSSLHKLAILGFVKRLEKGIYIRV